MNRQSCVANHDKETWSLFVGRCIFLFSGCGNNAELQKKKVSLCFHYQHLNTVCTNLDPIQWKKGCRKWICFSCCTGPHQFSPRKEKIRHCIKEILEKENWRALLGSCQKKISTHTSATVFGKGNQKKMADFRLEHMVLFDIFSAGYVN